MEKDDEVAGGGNSLDFGARTYDPRIGRWKSPDPKFYLQPDWSPYKAFYNSPLIFVDPEGETEFKTNVVHDERTGKTIMKVESKNTLITDGKKHTQGGSACYHQVNNYYHYTTHTVTTIHEDGSETITTQQKILYEGGVQDSDYVWFGGDANGDTKSGSIMNFGPQMLSFGFEVYGGGNGPVKQDKTDNPIGEPINFSDLASLVDPHKAAKKYKVGDGSINFISIADGSFEEMVTGLKDTFEAGQKIGEVISSVKSGVESVLESEKRTENFEQQDSVYSGAHQGYYYKIGENPKTGDFIYYPDRSKYTPSNKAETSK
ncbi:MAG: RHS repeat-associated protein [Patiriisocius sp.]|jgi:RHS repeat-associated protein